jgi:hypothetical protein
MNLILAAQLLQAVAHERCILTRARKENACGGQSFGAKGIDQPKFSFLDERTFCYLFFEIMDVQPNQSLLRKWSALHSDLKLSPRRRAIVGRFIYLFIYEFKKLYILQNYLCCHLK